MAAPFRRTLLSLINISKARFIVPSCASLTYQQPALHSWVGTPNQVCQKVAPVTCRYCSTNSASVEEDDSEPDVLYRSIVLEMKGHDPAVMTSYLKFLEMTCKELEVKYQRLWARPRLIERRSLLKSVHIYKKHFVQYETRTHFRNVELKHLTGSTADTVLEYIQRNLPEGMSMKVTRHRLEPLPSHVRPAPKQIEDDPAVAQT